MHTDAARGICALESSIFTTSPIYLQYIASFSFLPPQPVHPDQQESCVMLYIVLLELDYSDVPLSAIGPTD